MKNPDFIIRAATDLDMENIYMMGFDVWSDGCSKEVYLEGCRSSPKYQKGEWYVLENKNKKIVSSLITYSFDSQTMGIGSIATVPEMRSNGYATLLINGVLHEMSCGGVFTVFLYSDINPKLYENTGFQILPKAYQKYEDSICMVWGKSVKELIADEDPQVPNYF